MDSSDIPEDELRWEAVGAAEDWEKDLGKPVQIGARRIAVFHTDDGWSAIKDVCPHAGVALHDGRVCDGQVECPAHGWRFHLHDGTCDFGAHVATYPVRIVDGKVEVGV